MDMKKETNGIGNENNNKRKRDDRSKKKKTSNWQLKSEKPKAKETPEWSPVEHRPPYEVQEIKIADIKIEGKRRSLNSEKLNGLMESIPVFGLRQPITVRVIKRLSDWKNAKRKYALVTGFHRLEAKKRLGDTTIACIIMEGDERVARMWEISENLHRAELTPFEHDEQLVEWIKLLEAGPRFSGQKVQKRGRGRPKGGISEAARRLPIKGGTHAAKRKTVGRAQKVANIFPEAKEAVKKAGLDKNRSKYLKIAAEATLEAQLAKVEELAARESHTKNKRSVGLKQKAKTDPKTPLSADDTDSFKYLIEEWNKAHELKRAFINASPNVRVRFLDTIRQDHSLSTPRHARSTRTHWA
jgi:ParB-like chromosome segregation protein Spo0J